MSTPITYEQSICEFADQVRSGHCASIESDLKLGVDLGTANIVLSVIDTDNRPIAGAWKHSTVVRDGIVVDWAGAVQAVRELKEDVESRLRYRFTSASVSIPPAISPGTVKIFTNVIESAGMQVNEVVDEPVAAARVLGITDGCVIDVGHGTTGVSILKGGHVVKSIDEATGGHHMTLVLAGAYQLGYDQAEELKKNPERADDVFGVIRPTLEKMATIAKRAIEGYDLDMVYLVGGSISFAGAPEVFSSILSKPVVRPIHPLFVTPLGIAMTPPEVNNE